MMILKIHTMSDLVNFQQKKLTYHMIFIIRVLKSANTVPGSSLNRIKGVS